MPCSPRLPSFSALAALILVLTQPAAADVHDYIRFKRNGQLDYRRLLQRYEPVTSFGCGAGCFGAPYAPWGGLAWPDYYVSPGYYFQPHAAPGPAGYYGWTPVVHRY